MAEYKPMVNTFDEPAPTNLETPDFAIPGDAVTGQRRYEKAEHENQVALNGITESEETREYLVESIKRYRIRRSQLEYGILIPANKDIIIELMEKYPDGYFKEAMLLAYEDMWESGLGECVDTFINDWYEKNSDFFSDRHEVDKSGIK